MTGFLLRLGIMSMQATVIIGAVLLLRFIFSKLHIAKKYTIFLWIIPYIAMILPWGIKTPFSFWQITQDSQTKIEQAVNTMPYSADLIVQTEIDPNVLKEMEENRYAPPTLESIETGEVTTYENTWNGAELIPDSVGTNINQSGNFRNLTTWDVFIYVSFSAWLLGLIVFLTYGVVSSLKLKKKLVCSLLLSENIYVADDIKEPFVFGVLSPKIYLPCNLTKDNEYYVVEHEKTHIKRKDPLKKVAAFLITGIHWFNPFAWGAFHMMTKDMEMACDEETVQRIGLEKRKDYATALLKLSTKKRNLLIPVAFGEGNVKSRIHNVLKYKKTIKVLAVLATVVVIVLAVVFLTKPMEKTVAFGDMRNHDVVNIPKADNPKAITVTYNREEYTFNESYYDSFRVFLEELEVYEEELNKSRDETRPADVVIQLEGSVAYNFDKNLKTIWCDNGVKPSMTYEIVEPKLAKQFLMAQIGDYEGQSSENVIEGIIETKGEEGTSEPVVCGENGPFLDYADDKYVVFHTLDRFYVYDIELNEISMGIGFTDIFKVEVDAHNLKACVHDVEGDMITIYECDFANLSCCLYGPIYVDAFDDFFVTDECVVKDITVFRTKECIQVSDGNYLYLESGSGLLEDLCLIIEDKKGNRTVYEIFNLETYKECGNNMQVFTGAYYMEPLDITHDGKEEHIVVEFNDIQKDGQASAYLKVTDIEGNILWQNELGLARAGWNSYFIVWTKEGACLLQYLPVVMQERGEYEYRLFYLKEDGNEVEVSNGNVNFLMYPNNMDVDAKTAIPKEEMQAFAENLNQHLENARVLISTVNGVLLYQTPAKTYAYKEVYKMPLDVVDVEASENVELNITKLQNYYEKIRELSKQGDIVTED